MSNRLTPRMLVRESLLVYNRLRTEGNFLEDKDQTEITQVHVDFIFEDSCLEDYSLDDFSLRFIDPAAEKLSKLVPKNVKYYPLPYPKGKDILCACEIFNSVKMRFCICRPDVISQSYLYAACIDPRIASIDVVIGPERN